MAKRKRTQLKKSEELYRAKNVVRGALGHSESDLAKSVVGALDLLNEPEIDPFLQWIAMYPEKVRRIRPPEVTHKYADLWPKRSSIPVINDLAVGLKWITKLLVNHEEILARYVTLLEQYEIYVLTDQFDNALATIEAMESEIGLSVCIMEAKIAILQKTEGLEAQKKYIDSVRDAAPASLPAFIAYYTSERNEKNVSFTRYAAKIEEIIARQTVTAPIQKYLTRRLLGLKGDDITVVDIVHVMCVAGSLSVVDAYEGLIWACQTTLAKGLVKNFAGDMNECLSSLNVEDWRAAKLLSYISEDFSDVPLRDMGAECLLLEGKFPEAYNHAVDQLARIPDDADSMISASLALAYGGALDADPPASGLNGDITKLLSRIVAKSEGAASAASELTKLVLNFRSVRIMAAIYGQLVIEWRDAVQFGETESTLLFLSSRYLNILHWLVVAPPVSNTLKLESLRREPKSLTTQAFGDLSEGKYELPETIAKEMGQLINAQRAIYWNHFERSYDFLAELRLSEQQIWHRAAAKLELHCLLETHESERAIYRTSQLCASQDDLRYILPLRAILSGLRWKDVRHLERRIELSIIFDLYFRTIDEFQHSTNRRIAYDEFLRSHDCKRPTDLRKVAEDVDRDLLIYFLRRVCVQDVMDVSFDVYESSREIDEERIAICQWLSELCPAHQAEFSDEIVSLTKQMSIQDGLRDVDNSRVYVNEDAIGRWAKRELGEYFERYKLFVERRIGFGAPEHFEAALKDFAAGKADAVDDFLVYPNNEGDHLFLEMLRAITSEYLENSDYGLDAFLSMRIRHGSLAGVLRGPLEEQFLIVAKDANSDEYAANDAWVRRLRLSHDASRKCLVDAFAEFSREYDGIIEELVRSKLQIRKEKKPDGMLYLPVAENTILVHFIRTRVQHDSDFDDFLELVFGVIGQVLQTVLQQVREYISLEIKRKVDVAFENFRLRLEKGLHHGSFPELNSAIADVAPEVQAAIDHVAAWFLPEQNERGATVRTLEQIVDIGIEATKRTRRGFSPVVEKKIAGIDISVSSLLSEFTDILFTVLDNVYLHSGNSTSPRVTVEIQVNTGTKLGVKEVLVRVENEVLKENYNKDNINKLARIREQMNSGGYKQKANLEGGTGLLKLKRLVSLDPNQSLDFGYLGEDGFFVELKLIVVSI